MRSWWWLCAGLAACAGGEDEPSDAPPEATQVFVIRTLNIERITDGVSYGFDLDGVTTAAGDPTGCGQPDWTDPSGTPGIDNAIGDIMPLLDLTEAAVAGTLLQGAVDSGELLLLLEVSDGADGPGFRVMRGASEALVGTDGKLLPYQTFDTDPSLPSGDPVAAREEDDGSVLATDFAFKLPIEVLRATLTFDFQEAALRLGPEHDGVRFGVLGGGAPWAPIVDELNNNPIDESVKQILTTVVAQKADLDPDDQGICRSMSTVLSFEAVPAFVYADAP